MKKILVCILALVILAMISAVAFADPVISNRIIGEPASLAPAQSGVSGLEMILTTGDQKEIRMPDTSSYLYVPEYMYIDALQDHSVYVYKKLDGNKDEIMPFAFEGERVTVVATQGGMSCIVYYDEDFQLHAGWVYNGSLSYDYPGITVTCGTPCVSQAYTSEDPRLSWARESFVGTNQRYMILDGETNGCVQFKLDYQVRNRGGSDIEGVLGPRTVYVNDGGGWLEVGAFNFNTIQSYQVTVNLPEPMNVLAVAAIASCSGANRLVAREAVIDVLTVS